MGQLQPVLPEHPTFERTSGRAFALAEFEVTVPVTLDRVQSDGVDPSQRARERLLREFMEVADDLEHWDGFQEAFDTVDGLRDDWEESRKQLRHEVAELIPDRGPLDQAAVTRGVATSILWDFTSSVLDLPRRGRSLGLWKKVTSVFRSARPLADFDTVREEIPKLEERLHEAIDRKAREWLVVSTSHWGEIDILFGTRDLADTPVEQIFPLTMKFHQRPGQGSSLVDYQLASLSGLDALLESR